MNEIDRAESALRRGLMVALLASVVLAGSIVMVVVGLGGLP